MTMQIPHSSRFTTIAICLAAIFIALSLAPPVHAFPSWQMHLEGIGDLAGMLDLQGGVTAEKARSISRWMDNPATRAGQSRNHMAGGGTLSVGNHRAQRHNPVRAARVFSGDGTVSPQTLNQARIHKLQDIASARGVETGRAMVDGHRVTPAMQRKAQAILRHIRRFRRLPPEHRLPAWLDNSGPQIGRSVRGGALHSRSTVASNARQATTQAGRFSGVKAVARRSAVPVLVAVVAYEAYGTETAYANGELSASQRTARHVATGSSVAGGIGGAKAGAAGGAAVGTLICPGIGTAIGGVIGGLAGGVGGYAATRTVAEQAGESWSTRTDAEDEILRRQRLDAYGY